MKEKLTGFAEIIKNYRKRRDFSQKELADKLGVARTTIVSIESGKRRIVEHEIERISKILKIPSDEIFKIKNEQNMEFSQINIKYSELEEKLKLKQFMIGLTRLCNRFGFSIEGEIMKLYGDKITFEEITLDCNDEGFLTPIFLNGEK